MITDNGCVDTSACVNYMPMRIPELTIEEFTISPNPFTSQTTISFSKPQKNTAIKITDVVGEVIYQSTITNQHSALI